jgi:hypothetical protein
MPGMWAAPSSTLGAPLFVRGRKLARMRKEEDRREGTWLRMTTKRTTWVSQMRQKFGKDKCAQLMCKRLARVPHAAALSRGPTWP